MKIERLVKEVAKILGLKNEVIAEDGEVVSCQETDWIMLAINMANNNIASNYIEIIKSSEVTTKTGVIPFDDIYEFGIIDIKSVRKKLDNNNVEFSIMSDGVHIAPGSYVFEFSAFPNEENLSGDINYYTKIDCCIFVQGAVAEYLFLKGDIENAHLWDKKFKESLRSTLRPKRSFKIPNRRWE